MTGARLAAVLLAVVASACAGPRTRDSGGGVVGSMHADPPDGRPLRRVAMLPVHNETAWPDAARVVGEALDRQLAMRGRFEVLPLPPDLRESRRFEPARPAGVVSKEVLVLAARRAQADAVLFTTVTRYHPYEPVVIGVKVDLVSTGTGDVVWAADAIWDSSLGWVEEDVERWYETRLRDRRSLEGWRTILTSARLFADYVCHSIVATLP